MSFLTHFTVAIIGFALGSAVFGRMLERSIKLTDEALNGWSNAISTMNKLKNRLEELLKEQEKR